MIMDSSSPVRLVSSACAVACGDQRDNNLEMVQKASELEGAPDRAAWVQGQSVSRLWSAHRSKVRARLQSGECAARPDGRYLAC
jgi:hypothetical protein